MAYDGKILDDYVDVAERIAAFYEKYPEGSLQPADPARPWEQVVVEGYEKSGDRAAQTFIAYTAFAYRTPDDTRPGVGVAWEVFPGRTPYTRGSEVMNAETSAWGRAIAALGIATRKGIATRQEVQQARERADGGLQGPSACSVCLHDRKTHSADRCNVLNCACGRFVPLPTNADGSLSRSRTSDAEKAAAGVMTSAQQAEHTALRPKRGESRPATRSSGPDADPRWVDQPAAPLDVPPEDQPGTIDARQRTALHAAFAAIGVNDRAQRLDLVGKIVGRPVGSSNDLSYVEAGKVLAEIGKRTAKPKDEVTG